MAYKQSRSFDPVSKMVIPGKPGPVREHYCPSHDKVMTPVKLWGTKGIVFECKEGCLLGRYDTILK